jgi:hypothetical protein
MRVARVKINWNWCFDLEIAGICLEYGCFGKRFICAILYLWFYVSGICHRFISSSKLTHIREISLSQPYI